MNDVSMNRVYRSVARRVFALAAISVFAAMPLSAAPPQGCGLAAPDYVNAVGYYDTSVYIEWGAVPGATAYTVHILNDETGFWQPIRNVHGTSVVTWLNCGLYRIKVKASSPCEGLYAETQVYLWWCRG